jgi:hypothetical protein
MKILLLLITYFSLPYYTFMAEPIPLPAPTPFQSYQQGGTTPYTNTSNQTPQQGGENTYTQQGFIGPTYYGPQTTTPTTPPTPTPTPTTTTTNTPPPGPSAPAGAPNYASNTENQTVTYNGQTFKSDGKGGWVLAGGGQTGPSDEELNAVYNPTMNYLNQAESQVRSDYPTVLDAAQKSYESAIAELSGNKQKNTATIAENTVQAGQRKEDALTAARRLYDQLRQGYSQRFGGSSSAGAAASELASVEQQRQQGSVQRDYGTTMRSIETSRNQLETDYQTGQAKIQEQKTLALQQAQQNFTQQLLQIQSQRAQTESQKAAAKLQALTDLRNQAYQTQQQAAQYQQNLDMFYKQQQADLQTYAAKLQMAGQGSASAIAKYLPSTNPSSGLQVQNTNKQTTGGLTGSITKKPEDQLVGNMGSPQLTQFNDWNKTLGL